MDLPPSRAGQRRRQPATLQSVADAVGVSVQTVANTLRHPERVSALTRDRVISEVQRQGYRPNTSGRSLRTNRTNLIGISLSRPLSDGGVERCLRAAAANAEASGCHLLVFTEADGDTGAVYQDLLRRHAVDGFILTGTEVDDPRHVWLQDRAVPFVAIGRRWTTELGPFVDFDGVTAMELVVEHLAAAGRRSCAFVGPPGDQGVAAERLVGVEQAAADRGIEFVGVHTVEAGGSADERVRRSENAASDGVLHERPDAIVAADDRYASRCLDVLRRRGLTPGDEVAVVGYGDTPIAAHQQLTTVADPITEAAAEAVRMLTALIADPDSSPDAVMLTPSLVVRASG